MNLGLGCPERLHGLALDNLHAFMKLTSGHQKIEMVIGVKRGILQHPDQELEFH